MTETTTDTQKRYSLWLCLAPGSSELVQSVIDQLAAQHSSLTFCPHMTVCSGLTGHIDQLKLVVTRFAHSQQKNSLLGKRLSYRKALYQSLFIELKINDELAQFHQQTLKALDLYLPISAHFFPHISLAYLEPSSFDAPSQIKQLDKQLLHLMHCDRLVLMETSGNQPSWSQVLEVKLSDR